MKQINLFKSIFSFTMMVLLTSTNAKVNAQACPGTNLTVTMVNLVQTTTSEVQFDMYINNTGSTTVKLCSFPGGVNYNAGLVPAGSTMIAEMVSQPSVLDFPTLQSITPLVHQPATKQVRWQNNPPKSEPNAIPLPPNTPMHIGKMKLYLNVGVWPTNFPLDLVFNFGLPIAQYSQISPILYCNGNTNSTVASENFPGTMTLVNAPGIILNPIGFPVKYSNFEVLKQSNSNLVKWTTATESNNSYFNVQRSQDGINFNNIGKVASKAKQGNSSIDLSYSLEDKQPKIGHNYYRIEQVDYDGKSSFSYVIDIIWNGVGTSVLVYPNPTFDLINLDILSEKTSSIEVKLNDMSGRLLKTIKANAVTGNTTLQIDMTELAVGNYQMQVFQNNSLILAEKVNKL